jgi:hypothetical protein
MEGEVGVRSLDHNILNRRSLAPWQQCFANAKSRLMASLLMPLQRQPLAVAWPSRMRCIGSWLLQVRQLYPSDPAERRASLLQSKQTT